MSALVQYEEMRAAVERCARIDEAAEIRDKSAALAAYARQRDDVELEVWFSEIKLRACTRMGELVRELDTAERGDGPAGTFAIPNGGKCKRDAIADAGLSKSEAYRYQELAGGRDEQAQVVGKAAAETYFAKSRADKKPATMEGLRGAIREALTNTLGPRPEKQKKPPSEPADQRFIDFMGPLTRIAERDDMDPEYLASQVEPKLMRGDLETCKIIIELVTEFVAAVNRRFSQ